MAGTGALRLGPAARRLISPDRWTDGYPGPVAYSRELDVLLDWASQRNYLKRFVPNIEAKNTKRDEALNELRLAYPALMLDDQIKRVSLAEVSSRRIQGSPEFSLTVSLTAKFSRLAGVGFRFPSIPIISFKWLKI
jgi:hypothetical protein